ncbi:MAG TPA: Na+/H+ antiporter NhaA [Sphingobium sp.]|uniref:Na+/H+ antiporter NhaA n=1 Tax=Sphingobium sp. TaxID=1912891 RepID=UPI002ED556F3
MKLAPPSLLRAFLQSEAAGGALLIGASVLAMLIVNLMPGGAEWYHHALHAPLGPELTPKLGPMTAHLWINDGLMAIFFLVVGLEIKREWVDGRLASWDRRRLPFVAALAGMVVPALIYLLAAGGEPGLAKGWAIPAATDIAFALGMLALLGKRVPTALTLLLTTIAIVDDMGAIAIIAVAYTASLNLIALGAAAVILTAMFAMNRLGLRAPLPYLIGFALLWYALLLSGVHATLAGVLAAMTVPIRATPGTPDAPDSTLHRLEHRLHPWSAFLVVPIFGFANAGVALPGDMARVLLAPLPLGIAAGLFLGKQIGIFAAIRLAVATGFATQPRGATWLQVHAMALLCGIGFTMSLFIGGLAFPGHPELVEEAKIGVLTGSLLSALAGLLLLRFAPPHPDHEAIQRAQDSEILADGDVAE